CCAESVSANRPDMSGTRVRFICAMWRGPESTALRVSGRCFLRLHDQFDALVERQELRRGGADVADRERAVAREIFVEPVGIARPGVVRVQLIRLAAE